MAGRGRNRRRLVALLLLLAVSACGGGTGTGGGGQKSAADEPGDIVVASGRDVTGKNGIRQQLIDAWNKQQAGSGYRARLVELPGSADEQRSQLLGALQSGSADYDVVNLDVTWVPEFAAAGLIRPLTDDAVADPEDIVPSVAGTGQWKGARYAVPFNSDVGLLYYRPDFLRGAGVTQTDLTRGLTWSQLQNLMVDVRNRPPRGDKDYTAGWTTQLDDYEGRTVNAIEAFASVVKDFRITDASGHYVATKDQLADGIGELRNRTDSAYLLPAAVTSDEPASLSDFADGSTAFLRQWPYAYRTLYQTMSQRQLQVAPLPGKAVLGGQDLAVSSSSPRARTAADLIRFLTGKTSERCLLDAGFAATRTSSYLDDMVGCAQVPTTAATGSPSPGGETTDRMPRDGAGRPKYARSVLYPALQHAVQRPRTPLYGAFTQTFSAVLGELFTDRSLTNEELADRLDSALRKALPN